MERKVEKAINFIFSRRNLREMSIGVDIMLQEMLRSMLLKIYEDF